MTCKTQPTSHAQNLQDDVIFDIGANNGDDVPYYLLRAQRVVCVEANPSLAASITRRFHGEIRDGRVVVVNRVVATDARAVEVPFWIHRERHVLSQAAPPPADEIDRYERIQVPPISVGELFGTSRRPLYVKIDIERSDVPTLLEMFRLGIRPQYVSCELHSIAGFSALWADGAYRRFKYVDGATVHEKYRAASITTTQGGATYSFPKHSAGPFGDDIEGEWRSGLQMLYHILRRDYLGWKDLHAVADQSRPRVGRGGRALRRMIVAIWNVLWQLRQRLRESKP
jgi:FkbM family methyltransferase